MDEKKFAIEFNYLEMLGLHDYAKFKNMNLKDIVLHALEKRIITDTEYLNSLIEDKRELLTSIVNLDIPETKAHVKAIQESRTLTDVTDEELTDDEDSQEEVKSETKEQPIKQSTKNKPYFLRDEPREVSSKKKKVKAKKTKKKLT